MNLTEEEIAEAVRILENLEFIKNSATFSIQEYSDVVEHKKLIGDLKTLLSAYNDKTISEDIFKKSYNE